MPDAFVDIPGGSFSMGSHEGQDDEAPIHVVHVDAFAIAACPVTREEYATIHRVDGPSGRRASGSRRNSIARTSRWSE